MSKTTQLRVTVQALYTTVTRGRVKNVKQVSFEPGLRKAATEGAEVTRSDTSSGGQKSSITDGMTLYRASGAADNQ